MVVDFERFIEDDVIFVEYKDATEGSVTVEVEGVVQQRKGFQGFKVAPVDEYSLE